MSQDRDKDRGTDYGGPRIKRARARPLEVVSPTSSFLVAIGLAIGALGYSTFEISNLRRDIVEQQTHYATASKQADRQIRELTEKVDGLSSQLQSLTKDSSEQVHQIERLSSENRSLHDQLRDLSSKLQQQSPAK
jgi:septal ring factor EnvC (AmiA/AmiB activator)